MDDDDKGDNFIPIIMGLTASPVLEIHKDVEKIKS